ncbi:MAG: hypothetical protein MUF16_00735 [Burkholderiaceae bacterium]|nr:hypothetical protein [Burkholderiaceae bacterium]
MLLLALLWQSVAMARVGSTVNVLADPAHAALHWHEEGHHHHDDGSVHHGDSAESARHVLVDHVSATTALLTAPSRVFPPSGSEAPAAVSAAHLPMPDPDGLLRPPRFHS